MVTKPLKLARPPLEPRYPDTSTTDARAVVPKRARRTTVAAAPEILPADLICPRCDALLVYQETVIGGVKPIERWHYFSCQTCGPFVYRDRTRTLCPTA